MKSIFVQIPYIVGAIHMPAADDPRYSAESLKQMNDLAEEATARAETKDHATCPKCKCVLQKASGLVYEFKEPTSPPVNVYNLDASDPTNHEGNTLPQFEGDPLDMVSYCGTCGQVNDFVEDALTSPTEEHATAIQEMFKHMKHIGIGSMFVPIVNKCCGAKNLILDSNVCDLFGIERLDLNASTAEEVVIGSGAAVCSECRSIINLVAVPCTDGHTAFTLEAQPMNAADAAKAKLEYLINSSLGSFLDDDERKLLVAQISGADVSEATEQSAE